MNADDFFSNSVGSPRPFNNFNQWATDVNGPIWKNHTFFDVDYEGLREVLPTASTLDTGSQPAVPGGDPGESDRGRQCGGDPVL